jgi:hypothetical protein
MYPRSSRRLADRQIRMLLRAAGPHPKVDVERAQQADQGAGGRPCPEDAHAAAAELERQLRDAGAVGPGEDRSVSAQTALDETEDHEEGVFGHGSRVRSGRCDDGDAGLLEGHEIKMVGAGADRADDLQIRYGAQNITRDPLTYADDDGVDAGAQFHQLGDGVLAPLADANLVEPLAEPAVQVVSFQEVR